MNTESAISSASAIIAPHPGEPEVMHRGIIEIVAS
jgi:hypothetical protein